MLEDKSKYDGWKNSSLANDGVIGSWLTKTAVNLPSDGSKTTVADISIAAFVQYGIPACTIYVDNKSELILVLRDGKMSVQYTNADGETNWLDASDLDKLIKIKNVLK